MTVRLVDAKSFRTLTGLEPPERPPTEMEGERIVGIGWNNRTNEGVLTSISEHQYYYPSPFNFTWVPSVKRLMFPPGDRWNGEQDIARAGHLFSVLIPWEEARKEKWDTDADSDQSLISKNKEELK